MLVIFGLIGYRNFCLMVNLALFWFKPENLVLSEILALVKVYF